MTPAHAVAIRCPVPVPLAGSPKGSRTHPPACTPPGGLLVTRDEALGKQLQFVSNAEGTFLAPFDCWLLQRGVKTMAVRMQAQAATALRLARLLEGHPVVTRVNYPGLHGWPLAALQMRQATSNGSLLSFETGRLGVAGAIY